MVPVLTFPASFSSESFQDLEAHLKIFLRKAKRRAGADDEPPTRAASRCWRTACIQQLGNGSKELCWSEGFGEEDAVWNALGGPVRRTIASHINDRQLRLDFSGAPCDIPTGQLAASEIDVGSQRAELGTLSVKQFNSLLRRRSTRYLVPTSAQGFLGQRPDEVVIFNDQNNEQVFQDTPSAGIAALRGGKCRSAKWFLSMAKTEQNCSQSTNAVAAPTSLQFCGNAATGEI